MTLYASCGHECEIEDATNLSHIEWTITDQGYVQSIVTGVYCPECAEEYKQHENYYVDENGALEQL